MVQEIKRSLISDFLETYQSPFSGSMPEWNVENLTIDGKKFDTGICPWFDEIYKAIQDPSVKVVIIQGAAGLFKTGFQNSVTAFWMVNDPGKILQIYKTDEIGKDFAKTRLLPMLNKCEAITSINGGADVKMNGSLILLPHMDVKISGPSDKIQDGYSCKYLQIDDGQKLDEEGIFPTLFRRVRKNYKGTKVVVTATCGEKFYKRGKLAGGQLALLVHAGQIFRRSWCCPSCNKYQVHRFSRPRDEKKRDTTYSGINWDDVKKPDGSLDVPKTAATAKLECHFCSHKVDDTEINKIKLEKSARYELIEDGGDPTIRTFQIPAWVAPFNSYADAAAKYIRAKEQADARLFEQLKQWKEEIAAEEWEGNRAPVLGSFNISDSTAPLPNEKLFMAVDVQETEHWKYYLIVGYDDTLKKARIVHHGRHHDFSGIRDEAVKFGVMKENGENAHFVGVDCGYDRDNVFRACVKNGYDYEIEISGERFLQRKNWLCLRGDGNRDSYVWEDGIRRLVSEPDIYETDGEVPALVFYWTGDKVKNIVASIRDGHNPWKLYVPADEALHRQLHSESPNENGHWEEDSKENHWWDCLCMTYAMKLLDDAGKEAPKS
jgi:hypothetical protein